jgi:2-methylcitrate dehydratase PrpD
LEVTRKLAKYLASSSFADVPEAVRHERRRGILNYFGCAIGGSWHEAVEIAVRVLVPFSGPPTSGVLGRSERVDSLQASLLNGISSHVPDYDDTTPKNYTHPSSPTASAMCAYAATVPVTGPAFLHAFPRLRRTDPHCQRRLSGPLQPCIFA